MTFATCPAAAPASTLATSEAFAFVAEELPTCPDGSGDLWWDDASYARYQTGSELYVPQPDLDALLESLPSKRTEGFSPVVVDLTSSNYCARPAVSTSPSWALAPW